MRRLEKFRGIFYAAAAYNLVWSMAVSLAPNFAFDILSISRPNYPALWQCIGMMVGTFSIGYWLVARDPERYGSFVWIGLAGKVLGPLGYIVAAASNQLPVQFGWICLTNDVIWWIPFIAFLVHHRRWESSR